jgi:hypothetical protein
MYYYVDEIHENYILLLSNEKSVKLKQKYYDKFITNEQLYKYNKCNIILHYTQDKMTIGIINNKIKNTIIYNYYYLLV